MKATIGQASSIMETDPEFVMRVRVQYLMHFEEFSHTIDVYTGIKLIVVTILFPGYSQYTPPVSYLIERKLPELLQLFTKHNINISKLK